MGVYVDDMEAPFGRMVMCHLWADTHSELMAIVRAIGVQERWLQHPGTHREHFDIAKTKRRLAVSAGAVESEWREYALAINARRERPLEDYLR